MTPWIRRPNVRKITVGGAAFLALLYCSWPLSYVLNPNVGRHYLASQLEAPHQPYNWLFIALDVSSGCGLLMLCLLQYRYIVPKHIKMSVASYGVFGLLAAAAALIPLNCDPTVQRCGPLIHDPLIIFHGLCSIMSVAALFAGTVLITGTTYARRTVHRRWLFGGTLLLACWIFFGAGSVVEFWLRIKNNLLQNFFITVCSLSVVLVVAYIERLQVALHEVAEVVEQHLPHVPNDK